MNSYFAVIGSLIVLTRGEDQANLWLQGNYTKESYHNNVSDKGLNVFQEFQLLGMDERSAVSTGVWTAENIGYNLTLTGSKVEIEVFGMEYNKDCGGEQIGTKCSVTFPEMLDKTKELALWVITRGIHTVFNFMVVDWGEGNDFQTVLGNWTHGGDLVLDHAQVTLNLPVRECPQTDGFGLTDIDTPHIYYGIPNREFVTPRKEPLTQVSYSNCGDFYISNGGYGIAAYLPPQTNVEMD